MREIKFRAKDNVDNEWYYGDLLKAIDNDTTQCYFIVTDDYLSEATDIELYTCQSPEVLPETIGQFTGLYDKNKVPIYEGDILLRKTRNDDEWATIVLVKYGKVEFSFLHKLYNRINNPHVRWQRGTYQGLETYGEIIGNIYDNPDLLGE